MENYRDRLEKCAAWEEVFATVHEGYSEMSPENKRLAGEKILCKWTNIRDTFVKSLKTRMGRPKKKYIYYDHLKFLLKLTGEKGVTDYNDDSTDMKIDEQPRKTKRRRTEYNTDSSDHEYQANSEDYQNDNDVGIESVVVESNDPRIMNEDEAFFASLLPTVVKYSEDERLEFRIEVLAVMKRIREQRQAWSNV
ncbi:unnamed protein product [Leptosia nina]|uniref:BESS domain-containing protein n=1 Tax=Leptosia nina TaxID=320188 RepID=A0AAV1JBH5_9NEOP